MPVDLDQVRAQRAFQAAGAARTQGAANAFLDEARRLPTVFRTNGLLAGWGLLLARSWMLRACLEEHLRMLHPRSFPKLEAVFSPREGVEPLSTNELQSLTKEAILFAGWLKRAGEAVCDSGSGERADESSRESLPDEPGRPDELSGGSP